MSFNFDDHPHRRLNPLTGDYVLVSPHRTKRPWQGKKESIPAVNRPAYDPTCYLCPGNERAAGSRNPKYQSTFIFTNDFAALLPDTPMDYSETHSLFQVQPVKGTCRVICFSPRHDLSLAEMQVDDIRLVVDVWADQLAELRRDYTWVQIFENKGEMMGCSNPHPHGQIWAINTLPNEIRKEDHNQHEYFIKNGSPLLVDYLNKELDDEVRVVVENDEWVVVVPFWALWPFETLLLPKQQVQKLDELSVYQRDQLAEILKRLLVRYDNLFEISFPYSMGWHNAPALEDETPYWTLHAHFYPPLLRSATVKKFMVGYEMMAEAQRDLTPEAAAKRLIELGETHYRSR